jgi:hypothetical protein
MLSSLELRWLKPPKSLRLPLIVVCPSPDYWGLQHRVEKGEVLIGSTYYALDRGILQLNPDAPMDFVAIMVHEFRHHWQSQNGWKYDGIATSPLEEKFRRKGIVYPAWEASCEYFNQSKSEKDALYYQHKHRPDMFSEMITDWIKKRSRNKRRT